LFGFDSAAPWPRIDKFGLHWLLDGREVRVIDEGAARIQAPGGSVLTFYRKRREPK
jgi:hypothetical protein